MPSPSGGLAWRGLKAGGSGPADPMRGGGLPMRVEAGARTDVGCVRTNNEDSFRLVPALNLFIVSDGMGGEAHGEVASALAVQTVAAHCQESLNNPSATFFGDRRPDLSEKTNRLLSAVHLANREIHKSSRSNPTQRGMGATLLAAWLDGPRLSLVHVGDSRAYLLRSGALEQLTADHSLVAEQVRRGILTPQQAESSNMQSVLIRALGTHPEVEVDADEHLLLDGDTLLLCSDGLTRMVTEPEIASSLLTSASPQAAAARLVALANEYGGEDNSTVVVLRVAAEPHGLLARLRRWVNGTPHTLSSGGP
jgi:protein phosphatase